MADLLYSAVLEKTTGEQFSEEFDFDGIIPENTSVTDHEVEVRRADGVLATDDVVESSSHATTIVTVVLNTLETETAYVIKVSVVTSNLSYARQHKLLNVVNPGVFV